MSKLKTPAAATQNPAEAAAAEAISTPEKAASLVARLQAASDSEPKGSPRHRLSVMQQEQASIAMDRYQIEADRKRAAGAVQRDKATAEKSLDVADGQHAVATDNLKKAHARHEAIAARLQPLEAEKKNAQHKAQEHAAAAKSEFDAAIASGDDTAEAIAAEKLFNAKMAGESGTTLSGPLALRIEALHNELLATAELVTAQESAIQQATKARLKAKADLALVEYDRQAQALLEAYVAQRVAVSACGGVSIPGAGWVTDFHGRTVDQFAVQISSSERILLGDQIDAYNNRHLPSHVAIRIIDAMRAAPDLSILATKVEDLPHEIIPEPTAPEDRRMCNSAGLVVRPDGTAEEMFIPLPEDVRPAQAA